MKKVMLALALVVLVVFTAGYFIAKNFDSQPSKSEPQTRSDVNPKVLPPSEPTVLNPAKVRSQTVDETNEIHADEEPVVENYRLDSYAIQSMSQARQAGDPRAPVLSPSLDRVLPTADELADYDAYASYEQRQSQAVYREYIKAAGLKADFLRDMIAKAKQDGLSEEQIAEGEEKLRRIESMRETLLRDNPDLARELAAADASGG
jgi:hypothetical protein